MLTLLSSCSKYEEFNGGEFDLYLRSGDIYSVSDDEDECITKNCLSNWDNFIAEINSIDWA